MQRMILSMALLFDPGTGECLLAASACLRARLTCLSRVRDGQQLRPASKLPHSIAATPSSRHPQEPLLSGASTEPSCLPISLPHAHEARVQSHLARLQSMVSAESLVGTSEGAGQPAEGACLSQG